VELACVWRMSSSMSSSRADGLMLRVLAESLPVEEASHPARTPGAMLSFSLNVVTVAKRRVLFPLPLPCSEDSSSVISELEMTRDPLVVARVTLVTAERTEVVLAGGGAERVTESGTPLFHIGVLGVAPAAGAGAPVVVGAGAGAAGVGVVVVFVTALAAVLLFGRSRALCPVSLQTKQVNVSSVLK
jgi:hypothetical protein